MIDALFSRSTEGIFQLSMDRPWNVHMIYSHYRWRAALPPLPWFYMKHTTVQVFVRNAEKQEILVHMIYIKTLIQTT